MTIIPALLLAASFDAGAALEHAARLAALGPHPFGSPRTGLAAEYVAAQLRAVGLAEVREQRFTWRGGSGVNAIGVLRGGSPEIILLGAHHDGPEGSPAAWSAAGPAILIEAARALQDAPRVHTLVLASWDGGALVDQPGLRLYLDGLGADSAHLRAALILEGAGRSGGQPTLRAPPRADPLRPGGTSVAPAWLVRRALAGAQRRGARLNVADARLGWLLQVADRVAAAAGPAPDRELSRAGVPAALLSDVAAFAGESAAGGAADTADRLDAASIAAMGEALVGAALELAASDRGPDREPVWFAALGRVYGVVPLLGLAALSLLPVLGSALAGGAASLLVRAVHAAGFGLGLWLAPVPALWCFLPAHAALLRPRSRLLARLSMLPALALVAVVAMGSSGGSPGGPLYQGLWPAPWQLALVGLGLLAALARVPPPHKRKRR